jgi:hypothetical protein
MRLAALALGLALATPALAQTPPPGAAVTPNMGSVTGSGSLTNRERQAIGTWSVSAVLKDGHFTGSGSATINGATVKMPLKPGSSYLESGKCYFDMEQGRNRLNIGGPCTSKGVAGTMNGFIAEGEIYSVSGYMAGALTFAKPGAAPAVGVLPTAKLTCAWMERVGGNVGGQDYHYELRFSNMATLTLSANGTYRTANTSGKFVRGAGDTIRLTTGQFAGAIGHLQPDKSGKPAVYFERDENRNAKGVHIVDPQRTSCTVSRGG